jgi:hypothetical protein
MTKLTLSIKDEVLKTVKVYAEEKGQTLTDLIENYFKLISQRRKPIAHEELSPRVQRLRGIIKLNKDVNYKDLLTEELSKKYGR